MSRISQTSLQALWNGHLQVITLEKRINKRPRTGKSEDMRIYWLAGLHHSDGCTPALAAGPGAENRARMGCDKLDRNAFG